MHPRVIPRHEHGISRKDLSPNALRTLYRLRDHGFIAYIIGGCVRDLLIGRQPKDFDISTNATPTQIKRIFRNCRLVGRRFRLAHLYFQDEVIEVSTFRAAGPTDEPLFEGNGDANHDRRHVRDQSGMVLRDNIFGSPEEDALRRDFTINALAYSIADFTVIDYANGLSDLNNKVIRTIGDPATRFTEDPVRMLRAARFSGSLGFSIETETWDAMCDKAFSISRAAPARLFEEIQKLFLLGSAGEILSIIYKSGLFSPLFPMLYNWISADRERYALLNSILNRIDIMIGEGLTVSVPLLLAAILGPLIEERALTRHLEGMPRIQAIDTTCAAVLEDLCKTVRIPAKTGAQLRSILAFQHSLRKLPPRRPAAMSARSDFSDSLSYFSILSGIRDNNQTSVSWWNDFLLRQPAEPGAAVEVDSVIHKKRRKRRKRRKIVAMPS